jgi:threonylcarbamoyladenosine tRNA methylthiotransferase MtaB
MTHAPEIVTFGCRLNAYESEVIRALALEAGAGPAVIVNTCAVTTEATRQARQAIRRARRERPGARIIVTGCAAQIEPETFAAMPEVDLVLGNAEKLERRSYAAPDFGLASEERVRVDDVSALRETAHHLIDGFAGRTRAYVEVQNGCDHRCTFCIIPYGRGPSRSVAAGEVVAQVRRLVEAGTCEVVLTGVDVTAWGSDLPGVPRLGGLVRRILKLVPDLGRLRLTSLDMVEVDGELMAAIAEEPRLMPHFHLSLQAGDDMILKRMKRRHSRKDALDFIEGVRRARPDAVFGADLIAGFPTETEAMFANTLSLVGEAGITYLHVFPFSPRPGTPAARMPQVEGKVVRERARLLRAAGEAALKAFLAGEVGCRREVLMETGEIGRTPHYAPVRLSRPAPPGSLLKVEITGSGEGRLDGRPLP